jgi:hypothetical protein
MLIVFYFACIAHFAVLEAAAAAQRLLMGNYSSLSLSCHVDIFARYQFCYIKFFLTTVLIFSFVDLTTADDGLQYQEPAHLRSSCHARGS